VAVGFELVRVSDGEDLQLLSGEPGNIVRVIGHANVLNRLLGRSAVGVLEHPQSGAPRVRTAGVEVLVQHPERFRNELVERSPACLFHRRFAGSAAQPARPLQRLGARRA
jgi:hypothetical protein